MYPYEEFSELFPQIMVLMGPKIYGESEVTPQQFRVLRIIGQSPTTVGEISHSINSKLSAAARLLRRLEEKGWIVKRQDLQDRRVFWLELTQQGQALLLSMSQRREQVIQEMFNKLSSQEQIQIADGIRLLLKSLTEAQ